LEAPCEADMVCAYMVREGHAWACLSEDMDFFVYGCPRIIRYLSLLNHTAVSYDTNNILKCLGISQRNLREICILSGTDYNINNEKNSPNLYSTLKLFKKYFKEIKKNNNSVSFYDWLIKNTNYIQDYELLLKINDIFDLSKNNTNMKSIEAIRIANNPIMKEELREILKLDGFLFPN
jgi:5'-3' exonuclease